MVPIIIDIGVIGFLLVLCLSLVTGKCLSLGSWYSRQEEPKEYWGGVVSYIIVLAALIFAKIMIDTAGGW